MAPQIFTKQKVPGFNDPAKPWYKAKPIKHPCLCFNYRVFMCDCNLCLLKTPFIQNPVKN